MITNASSPAPRSKWGWLKSVAKVLVRVFMPESAWKVALEELLDLIPESLFSEAVPSDLSLDKIEQITSASPETLKQWKDQADALLRQNYDARLGMLSSNLAVMINASQTCEY